jgi:peptidoglycan/xylan/chitin deacetylase (PgdA/CDA1 family)
MNFYLKYFFGSEMRLKNKLFISGLIIIMALSVLVACTRVIAPTMLDGITSENNSAAVAPPDRSDSGYLDAEPVLSENNDHVVEDGADEANSFIHLNSEYDSDTDSDIGHNVDEDAEVYGGDTIASATPSEPPVQIASASPDNNSIRATRIRSTSTKIAVTFDDGPAPYTERILDVLEQYDSRATFFVTGSRILFHPEIVSRAFEMGNEVANHSWSHRSFPRLNDAAIQNELQRTCNTIREVLGFSPPIFRPPYGATNDRVVRVAGEMGYAVIKWTLDPKDWRYRNADIIYNSVMSRVEGGSVILLHDVHPTTADAVELLIPSLIEAGFELVTVTELLTYLYGELTPGRIYGMQVITD